MKIRNRQSVVTTFPEEKAKTPLSSGLTKAAYLLALGLLLGYGLLYVIDRVLRFRADGYVTIRSTLVAASRDGRIAWLGVEEGDEVRESATLAVIRPAAACAPPDFSELARLRVERDVARSRLALAERRLEEARARLDSFAGSSALELDGAAAARRRLADEVRDLAAEREHAALDMRAIEQRIEAWEPRETGGSCEEEIIRAPIAGHVTALQRSVAEVVDAGDPILRLTGHAAPVRVMAWLSPDAMDDVTPGQTVEVRFPDGTRSEGTVARVLSEAVWSVALEREGYRPLPSDLLAEIRPPDREAAERWRGFDGLRVEVVGSR